MSTNVQFRSYAHLPTTELDPTEFHGADEVVDDRATVAMAPLFSEEWPRDSAALAGELGPDWLRLPIGSRARVTDKLPLLLAHPVSITFAKRAASPAVIVNMDDIDDDLRPARDGRNLILIGAIGLVGLALWLAVLYV